MQALKHPNPPYREKCYNKKENLPMTQSEEDFFKPIRSYKLRKVLYPENE